MSKPSVQLKVLDKLELHKCLLCVTDDGEKCLVVCFTVSNFSSIRVGDIIKVTADSLVAINAGLVEIL